MTRVLGKRERHFTFVLNGHFVHHLENCVFDMAEMLQNVLELSMYRYLFLFSFLIANVNLFIYLLLLLLFLCLM